MPDGRSPSHVVVVLRDAIAMMISLAFLPGSEPSLDVGVHSFFARSVAQVNGAKLLAKNLAIKARQLWHVRLVVVRWCRASRE